MEKYLLEEYANILDEELDTNKGPMALNNDSRSHAKILIQKIIERAKKKIVILCHRLAREIYGSEEVVNALKKAYANNKDLEVIVCVRNDVPDLTPFVSTLLRHNADIRLKVKTNLPDVIVVDGMNGRVEIDPIVRKGLCLIHNEEKSRELERKIEALA